MQRPSWYQDKAELEGLYRAHGSLRKIAMVVGISYGAVHKAFEKHGVARYPAGGRPTYREPVETSLPAATPQELVSADRRAHRLHAEIKSLRKRNNLLAREANIIDDVRDILEPAVSSLRLPPPERLPQLAAGAGGIILVLHLSDMHWGEIVDPDLIGGLNAYSPGIAARRVQHAVDVTREWVQNYEALGGVAEIVLVVNGDTASGQHNLHPDSATEYARIATQVLDSALIVAQVVRELAALVPAVRVMGTQGNHTRSTHRMPTGEARSTTSWETLIHEFVAALVADCPTARFQISRGYRLTAKIGPSTWSIAHGDALKGGGGQLGIPAYALKRAHDANRDFSVIAAEQTGILDGVVKHSRIGHFHMFTTWQVGTGDVAICPSIKGADAFVTDSLAKYSPAGALLEAVHPDHDIVGQHVINLQGINQPGVCRYAWGARQDESITAVDILRESL